MTDLANSARIPEGYFAGLSQLAVDTGGGLRQILNSVRDLATGRPSVGTGPAAQTAITTVATIPGLNLEKVGETATDRTEVHAVKAGQSVAVQVEFNVSRAAQAGAATVKYRALRVVEDSDGVVVGALAETFEWDIVLAGAGDAPLSVKFEDTFTATDDGKVFYTFDAQASASTLTLEPNSASAKTTLYRA